MSWHIALFAAVLSALALEGLSQASAATLARPDAQYKQVPCWFEVESDREIDCGQLIVPENWSKRQTNLLHLPVVVFRAERYWGPAKEPIVFLQGGPGGRSGIRSADGINNWLNFLNAHSWTFQRNFIVLAQRGTNWTDSNLGCPSLKHFWSSPASREPDWPEHLKAETLSCGRQLADGHDLSGYNSPQNAFDIAALRRLMGIERWSIYAVSYGTRYALTLMAINPLGIRSVILDSVLPPAKDSLRSSPSALADALGQIFGACEADHLCDAHYPHLKATFASSIAELRRQPLHLTAQGSNERALDVDSALFIQFLFDLLSDSDTVGAVPEAVHEFEGHPTNDMITLLEQSIAANQGLTKLAESPDEIMDGAFITITCNDDYEHKAPDLWEREAARQPLMREWIQEQEFVVPCENWPVTYIGADARKRVASDIPTLLLSGIFDPKTPPEYAKFAAATLERSQVFVFPVGHDVLGSDPCGGEVAGAFLDNPGVRPDVGCLQGLDRFDFSLSLQMRAADLVQKGRLSEAEQLLRETLADQNQKLRAGHPNVAKTLDALGELYYNERRLSEAEGVLRRALAINGKAYGLDSVEAALTAGQLALVYHEQGRYAEAEPLYKLTLRVLDKEHGEADPQTAFYRNQYNEMRSNAKHANKP